MKRVDRKEVALWFGLLALGLTAGCAAEKDRAQPAPQKDAKAAADSGLPAGPDDCTGEEKRRGGQTVLALSDGSTLAQAPMTVNIDGAGRAYHEENYAGGGLIHLCNGGQVHLPDGTRYHGYTQCGKFLEDYERIRTAGWDDPQVGAIRWYGVLAEGSAEIAGRTVQNVTPVLQPGGSGFYVSPTALGDPDFSDRDQRRYLDALTVPYAAIRSNSGVPLGTLGMAWRVRNCPEGQSCEPEPFIVGDYGPKIGEGSLALGRAVNGLDPEAEITRDNRYAGHIGKADVVYVFFGGAPLAPPYSAPRIRTAARDSFAGWGGKARLQRCAAQGVPPANG